jgi:hypothetical protein
MYVIVLDFTPLHGLTDERASFESFESCARVSHERWREGFHYIAPPISTAIFCQLVGNLQDISEIKTSYVASQTSSEISSLFCSRLLSR